MLSFNRAMTSQLYNQIKAYNDSKFSSVCFNKELARRFASKAIPVNVFLASPGLVYTKLGRHVKLPIWKMILVAPIAAVFLRTPTQGCQTILHCALSTDLSLPSANGRLYRNCKETEIQELAVEVSTTKRVYELTMNAIANYSDFFSKNFTWPSGTRNLDE